jgi:hypothetical protein
MSPESAPANEDGDVTGKPFLRQCSRCRESFDVGATLFEQVGLLKWWLCEPCRKTLIGS